MARDLNKIQLIGYVGVEPEGRYTLSGNIVCNLRLATSRAWNDGEQRREETTWHNLVLWDRLAEIAVAYVHKGSRIYVEGRLTTRSWEDPDTGQTRSRAEIVCTDLIFIDGRRVAGDPPAEESPIESEEPLVEEPAASPAAQPIIQPAPEQEARPAPRRTPGSKRRGGTGGTGAVVSTPLASDELPL